MIPCRTLPFIAIHSWMVQAATRHSTYRSPTNSVLAKYGSTSCSTLQNRTTIAPKDNVWLELTGHETEQLQPFLYAWLSQQTTSNKTATGSWNQTTISNWIQTASFNDTGDAFTVYLLYPSKKDVLAYLDGNGSAPARYGQFIQQFRNVAQPYVRMFSVGPLPLSNYTNVQPLDHQSTLKDGKVLLKESLSYTVDDGSDFLSNVTASMQDIIADLVGSKSNASPGINPKTGYTELGREVQWFNHEMDGPASTLLVSGLYYKLDMTKAGSNGPKLLSILYNGKTYKSVEMFRSAWSSPNFEKLLKAEDGDWAQPDQFGKPFAFDDEPGPAQTVGTQRFVIDYRNRYVEWMGFSFYMGVTVDNGLALHDIKYDNERIIFELALQEAMAHYASNDPLRGGTLYLDSAYGGLGGNLNTLVRGWDCPAYATYLDSHIRPGSICIFERDAGFPLARHYANDYVNVVKNNILVVRTIATFGNYDYMFDYTFYYDGTIEVSVRASGYIQGTFYEKSGDYGYRIHDALAGAMHDHVINYKLDLDVKGTANTLQRVDIVPVTAAYPGSNDPTNTMQIKRSFISNENEGKIDWSPNAASMYLVVNKDSINPYGEYRGYRIAPGYGAPAHLTSTSFNSSIVGQAANFAHHHLFVTKRKDEEPFAAVPLNEENRDDPYVNFDKFFDGESIEQEDIVLWFNLGMHHVPHTGDLPNTIFQTAQASLVISPHNYLLGSPTKRVKQAVKIDLRAENNGTPSYVGSSC